MEGDIKEEPTSEEPSPKNIVLDIDAESFTFIYCVTFHGSSFSSKPFACRIMKHTYYFYCTSYSNWIMPMHRADEFHLWPTRFVWCVHFTSCDQLRLTTLPREQNNWSFTRGWKQNLPWSFWDHTEQPTIDINNVVAI